MAGAPPLLLSPRAPLFSSLPGLTHLLPLRPSRLSLVAPLRGRPPPSGSSPRRPRLRAPHRPPPPRRRRPSSASSPELPDALASTAPPRLRLAARTPPLLPSTPSRLPVARAPPLPRRRMPCSALHRVRRPCRPSSADLLLLLPFPGVDSLPPPSAAPRSSLLCLQPAGPAEPSWPVSQPRPVAFFLFPVFSVFLKLMPDVWALLVSASVSLLFACRCSTSSRLAAASTCCCCRTSSTPWRPTPPRTTKMEP
ncbi:hypothetical protein BRADI_2g26386v3 [Brachypodium distachyon]|uniref:Uncharacterized protein n=1 Tax=Brachypodium distachyon TaxID=15368 RepID=A0A0Q3J1A0_BRADI|nr:hypothetical protein BRADI_2g26386v3 [Brachypodium distachyon]